MISRRDSMGAGALAAASAVGGAGPLAAICAVGVQLPAPTAVQVAFGVPLVLFLPGYALASVLLGRRARRRSSLLMLSVALSFAVAIIGTLVLNSLPYGVTKTTWTALLAGVTIVAALCGVFSNDREAHADRSLPVPTVRQVAAVVVGVCFAAGAVVFARTPLPAAGITGYTSLWVLPREPGSVVIGVDSKELERTAYRLEVDVDGQPAVRRSYSLTPGWGSTTRIDVESTTRRVDARLYQADSGALYRRVRLLTRRPGENG